MKGCKTPDPQSGRRGSSRGRGSGSAGNSSGKMEGSVSCKVQNRHKTWQAVDRQLNDVSVAPNLHTIARTPGTVRPETVSSNEFPRNKSRQSSSPKVNKEFPVSNYVNPRNISPQNIACQVKIEGPVSPDTGARNESPESGRPQLRHNSPKRVTSVDIATSSGGGSQKNVFDIFKSASSGGVKLQKSLLEINRERRREAQCNKDAPRHEYLRDGMVLLKRFIGHEDQVKIACICRKLGIGDGGFYRPGYTDGAKLRLNMMCLGKNWDPESRLYENKRPIDGAAVPQIPEEFKQLVSGAIKASHDVVNPKNADVRAEQELPSMSPDICIINFYSNEGRLGLHQDRDESAESIRRGLPVVSFSIGDSADFVYGEGRDENEAEKVLLESGDVLIFGGKSRMIFHGVPHINQNTAPKRLIEECNLKPGRLNLTFRQY